MPGGFIEVKMNTDALDRMIKRHPDNADQVTSIAADLVVNDIRDHWSGSSPSSPGASPAVVTGDLDSSINSQKTQGGLRPTYQVGASSGHAGYLEYGTRKMAKRPFIYPAMKRMRNQLAGVFKTKYKP